MIAPSVFNDVNGEYRGADGKTHKGDFTDYTTFSLWDTYRSSASIDDDYPSREPTRHRTDDASYL